MQQKQCFMALSVGKAFPDRGCKCQSVGKAYYLPKNLPTNYLPITYFCLQCMLIRGVDPLDPPPAPIYDYHYVVVATTSQFCFQFLIIQCTKTNTSPRRSRIQSGNFTVWSILFLFVWRTFVLMRLPFLFSCGSDTRTPHKVWWQWVPSSQDLWGHISHSTRGKHLGPFFFRGP